MKIFVKIALLFVCTVVPHITPAMCGVINFAGGTWSIQQIHGDEIEVKNVELAGDGIMFFTRPDGSKGFVNISNVSNLKELENMVNNHVPDASSQERQKREKDNQLKNKSNNFYFNMKEYCQSVSAAVGGSYQIEHGCIMNEKAAKRSLDSMHIEKRILKFCEEVSEAVGGSYQIMQGCVINERSSRNSLR